MSENVLMPGIRNTGINGKTPVRGKCAGAQKVIMSFMEGGDGEKKGDNKGERGGDYSICGARKMCWCAETLLVCSKWAGALRVKFAIFFLLVRWLHGWCAGTFSNSQKIIITIFFQFKNIIFVISMSKLIKNV